MQRISNLVWNRNMTTRDVRVRRSFKPAGTDPGSAPPWRPSFIHFLLFCVQDPFSRRGAGPHPPLSPAPSRPADRIRVRTPRRRHWLRRTYGRQQGGRPRSRTCCSSQRVRLLPCSPQIKSPFCSPTPAASPLRPPEPRQLSGPIPAPMLGREKYRWIVRYMQTFCNNGSKNISLIKDEPLWR